MVVNSNSTHSYLINIMFINNIYWCMARPNMGNQLNVALSLYMVLVMINNDIQYIDMHGTF